MCLILYFDFPDPIPMLKQVCFPINTIGNWRPNLLAPDKETENTVIILQTTKM